MHLLSVFCIIWVESYDIYKWRQKGRWSKLGLITLHNSDLNLTKNITT